MLGIVILNYNNAEATINCFESVKAHNSWPSKYIIVDNASTDGSVATLRQYFEAGHFDYSLIDNLPDHEVVLREVSLITSPENGGYAQGNNLGLKLIELDTGIDLVMILNNDVLFVEDIVPPMAKLALSDYKAGLISPLLLKRDGKGIDYNCARKDCTVLEVILFYLFYCRDRGGILAKMVDKRKLLQMTPELLEEKQVPIELPSGSCMLIRKELFKASGYFDPGTFLYYEENILFCRLKKLGVVNYVLPNLRCIHLGSETTTKVSRDYDYLRRSNYSGYYYLMKYRKMHFCQTMVLVLSYKLYSFALWARHTQKRLCCKI